MKRHCDGKGHSEQQLKSEQSSIMKSMDRASSSQTNKVIAAPPTSQKDIIN